MTQNTPSREYQRLLEVAREYRQRGYEVIIDPAPKQLPDFLTRFRVDMLAHNDSENVILEVRTQESITQTPGLDAIAQAVHDQPNWRFELVVTNPKNRLPLELKNAVSLDANELSYRLREAKQLAEEEHGEAAVLLVWSATEAILRHIAVIEGITVSQHSPVQLIKNLYAQGVLDQEQYNLLQQGMQLRNTIIHGYKEQSSLTTIFNRLIDITRQLIHAYPQTLHE
jgi:uncharacterized protein YutE (UPF0331/DUF86 family)